MLTVNCKDCGKPHSVPFNHEGTLGSTLHELEKLEIHVTKICECKFDKTVPHIVAASTERKQYGRYNVDLVMSNGSTKSCEIEAYSIRSQADIRKGPSWKKANDYMKTPEGLAHTRILVAKKELGDRQAALDKKFREASYKLTEEETELAISFMLELKEKRSTEVITP